MPHATLLSDAQYRQLYLHLQSEPVCKNNLEHTIKWMQEQGVQNIKANVEKLVNLGGHCDCEILFNISPEIWHEQRDETIQEPDILGEDGWNDLLARLIEETTGKR